MRWAETFEPLVDFLYPPRCPSCGGAIASQTGLCADCWARLELPGAPACAACQHPLTIRLPGGEALCDACAVERPRHDGIAAATLYGPVSRALVLALKHGGRIALARMMGEQMAARLPEMAPDALVVPVPLHRWRLWKRGYNQSALMARTIARRRGLALLADGLERVRATPSLGGLDPAQRRRALDGAIRANPRRRATIAGREVVLVDDVMTSGATSDRCVAALREAGAARVVICCYARVLADRTERRTSPLDGTMMPGAKVPATVAPGAGPERETPGTIHPGRSRDDHLSSPVQQAG